MLLPSLSLERYVTVQSSPPKRTITSCEEDFLTPFTVTVLARISAEVVLLVARVFKVEDAFSYVILELPVIYFKSALTLFALNAPTMSLYISFTFT